MFAINQSAIIRASRGDLWFTVEGSGQFPAHLLTHDGAKPVALDDEVKMHPEATRQRVIFLKSRKLTPKVWMYSGWRLGSSVEEVVL